MRIISGTARGCKLAEFSIATIRPTPDRVREAVFSILISKLGSLAERTVLDLFAGTGAMGLEALSRGAASATFIDQSKEATGLIQKNATSTRLAENAEIIQAEVSQGIAKQSESFDLIFMDPPYGKQDIDELLFLLAEQNILKPGGVLCVETAPSTALPDMISPLVQVGRRKYGATSISLYEHGDFSK